MPGFFVLFFRPNQEDDLNRDKGPEPPKPKKVKKVKKPKEDTSLVDSLRAEIAELREMVTTPEPEPQPEPEPEPVLEAEEPEDDDPNNVE